MPNTSLRNDDRLTRRSAILLVAGLSASLSQLGCHQGRRKLAPVTGRVTYRGQPLRFGTVILQPESGQYAIGEIQPDGTFSMATRGEGQGAAVGKNSVGIACYEGQAPGRAPSAPPSMASTAPPPADIPLIPRRYLSHETSGIVVDVLPGRNEPLILDLKDE